MSSCAKLPEKAKRAPASLRFDDLKRLAECYGWICVRQSDSHVLFFNEALADSPNTLMNFQNRRVRAKPYQVRELLDAIERLSEDEG